MWWHIKNHIHNNIKDYLMNSTLKYGNLFDYEPSLSVTHKSQGTQWWTKVETLSEQNGATILS